MKHGVLTITPGTPVKIPVSGYFTQIIIQAKPSNTGDVVIGGAGVTTADYGVLLKATSNPLVLGEETTIPTGDLYFDGTVGTDKVSYLLIG